MKFGLIGDGKQAQFHRDAISHTGGEIVWVYDPKYNVEVIGEWADYAVICSPSYMHRSQITAILSQIAASVIVEKPCVMPWEPLIDDDRINITLQYRYAPLPPTANTINVTMIRDQAYFDTWKGDPRKTGGIFFNLFIHYIDLAIKLNADFRGAVLSHGTQIRRVDDIDLFQFNTQELYNAMYADILNGGGVKPKDLFYLHYIMEKYSRENGFGKGCLNKHIFIPKELL